jgi:SAM-dependent methyltransferase
LISSAFPYEADRVGRCDYLSTAALWRRSALLDLGGWSEELTAPRDVVRDLWWRLGRAGHAAAFVQRPVVRQVMAHAPDERTESGAAGAGVVEGRRSVVRRPYDGVSTEIHRQDYLFQFLLHHPEVDDPLKLYIQDGRNSARRLRELLDEHAADPPTGSLTVLEFASGYGCVSRHLARQVPNAEVTCSDIHPEAMDFIGRTFSMETQLSVARPEMFALGRQFDVVFALSFFSHMPERTWGPWLEALYRHTRPGGMLVFTAHGLVSDELHIRRAVLSPEGFWFEPTSEQMDLDGDEYGVTVTSREYVMRQITTRLPDAATQFSEAFWWGHQDLYVVKRPPEAPASDAARDPRRAARRVGPGPGGRGSPKDILSADRLADAGDTRALVPGSRGLS